MKIISASIDLTKIDKNKIQKTDKNGQPYKNGQQYYNITIIVKDEPDQYKNDVAITDSQTKEQREAKEKATFIGNGKVVFNSESQKPSNSTPQTETEPDDSLPF